MTVEQLIAELQEYPSTAEVRVMSFMTDSGDYIHRVGEDGMDDISLHDIVSIEDSWDHAGTDGEGNPRPAVSIEICRNPQVKIKPA